MKVLPEFNGEQIISIDAIGRGDNVRIDAVAGSGKTMTVLGVANKYRNLNILLITYNRKLNDEVCNKLKEYKLEHVNSYTYHGLAVKFYNRDAHVDEWIKYVIDKDSSPIESLPSLDVLIVDETQDMTPLLFKFLVKFNADMERMKEISRANALARNSLADVSLWNKVTKYVFLGDRHQCVYGFKGADHRFLTMADKIWNREFTKCSLRISYRVTHPIAKFVNKCMLQRNHMTAVRGGPIVNYIRCNQWTHAEHIAIYIKNDIANGKYKAEDIFILSPSIKINHDDKPKPFQLLENMLVKYDIACHVSSHDAQSINEEVIKNKVVFTTFHQSKGLERKCVIIFGFDNSYFTYYAKDKDPNVCPSELYVAVTRAKEHLYLISHCSTPELPFLTLDDDVRVINYDNISRSPKREQSSFTTFYVTDFIKFLSPELFEIDQIDKLFTVDRPQNDKVVILPHTEKFGDLCEEVSDLVGTAIPSLVETRRSNMRSTIERMILESNTKFSKELSLHISNAVFDSNKINDRLYIANIYRAINDKLLFRLKQITNYNWLSEDTANYCIEQVNSICGDKNTLFETSIDTNEVTQKMLFEATGKNIIICGLVDLIVGDTLYELKCVQEFTLYHKLQLIIYAWLQYNSVNGANNITQYKLLNMRTGEILRLNYDAEKINDIVMCIAKHKMTDKRIISDEEFLAANKSAFT